MRFEGCYNGDTKGKHYVGKPIFGDDKSVIVFDVDDTLLLQKPNYVNGRRNGRDNYILHSQSRDVVFQALKDFDKVVIWSARDQVFDYFRGSVFDSVHLRIAGGVIFNEDMLIKDLRILSADLSKVVALQDGIREITFEPLNRTVRVGKGENLMARYSDARVLVNGRGFKTGKSFEKFDGRSYAFAI